jgi:hypothetical protein
MHGWKQSHPRCNLLSKKQGHRPHGSFYARLIPVKKEDDLIGVEA